MQRPQREWRVESPALGFACRFMADLTHALRMSRDEPAGAWTDATSMHVINSSSVKLRSVLSSSGYEPTIGIMHEKKALRGIKTLASLSITWSRCGRWLIEPCDN